jgi:hypothetical protein
MSTFGGRDHLETRLINLYEAENVGINGSELSGLRRLLGGN